MYQYTLYHTGCVLVASEGLHDGGIFARSVVLITDHSPTRGTRGVILTAPLHGLQDPLGPSGALRHMVGGPVGAPGSSQPEEVLLHTAAGVCGARQLLPVLPSGPPPPPPALQLRGAGAWAFREEHGKPPPFMPQDVGLPLFVVRGGETWLLLSSTVNIVVAGWGSWGGAVAAAAGHGVGVAVLWRGCVGTWAA